MVLTIVHNLGDALERPLRVDRADHLRLTSISSLDASREFTWASSASVSSDQYWGSAFALKLRLAGGVLQVLLVPLQQRDPFEVAAMPHERGVKPRRRQRHVLCGRALL